MEGQGVSNSPLGIDQGRMVVVTRTPYPIGELVLKAKAPRLIRAAVHPEHERSLWGPHIDPVQAWIEESLYQVGLGYLKAILSFTLGKPKVTILKADPPPFGTVKQTPAAPGWGEIRSLFHSPLPAEQVMYQWENLIDLFTTRLFPGEAIRQVAAAWALRSTLLGAIGERVKQIGTQASAPIWNIYERILPPSGKEQLEWQRENGAQFITHLKAKTRAAVLDVLVQAKLDHTEAKPLEKQLFEKFGQLNRDWRRIAITETAMSVESGKLAVVADQPGWEAVWGAGPHACQYCSKMAGKVFKIVKTDNPKKNGDTDVWAGKNNVGRSMHLFTKDGRKRKKSELWQPCIPAHPNCMCGWLIRKALTKETPDVIKRMQAHFDEMDKLERKRSEEFRKTIKPHIR